MLPYNIIKDYIDEGAYIPTRASGPRQGKNHQPYVPPLRDFRADLMDYAKYQGCTNQKALDRIYEIASEMNNGSGYYNFLQYFDDLLEICKIYEI